MAILVLLSQLQKIYKLHTCALLHRFQILYIGRGYNFFYIPDKTIQHTMSVHFPGIVQAFLNVSCNFLAIPAILQIQTNKMAQQYIFSRPLVSTKAIFCFLSVYRTKQSPHPPKKQAKKTKQIHHHLQAIRLKLSNLFQAISDK